MTWIILDLIGLLIPIAATPESARGAPQLVYGGRLGSCLPTSKGHCYIE